MFAKYLCMCLADSLHQFTTVSPVAYVRMPSCTGVALPADTCCVGKWATDLSVCLLALFNFYFCCYLSLCCAAFQPSTAADVSLCVYLCTLKNVL